jgi:hypothetical protein
MSVIRMTIPVSSIHHSGEGTRYILEFPRPMEELGWTDASYDDLRALDAQRIIVDRHGNTLRFDLDRRVRVRPALEAVAKHLRHHLDFGGGVEFKLKCTSCQHEDTFVL